VAPVNAKSDADAVEACFQKHMKWVTDQSGLVTKKTTCETSSTTATSKTAVCNVDQTSYQNNACSYKQKLSSTCDAFDTCLAPVGQETLVNKRITVLNNLAVVVVSQKGVYKATKTAKCYLDLLLQTTPPTQVSVQACADEVVNDGHLNLSYPIKVEPGTCDVSPASTLPGDGAWVVAEYQSQDWAALVQPVVACTAATVAIPVPISATSAECPHGEKSELCASLPVWEDKGAPTGQWSQLQTMYPAKDLEASAPANATMIRVKMGDVVDFFMPSGVNTISQMLVSHTKHLFSYDGRWWTKPAYAPKHNGGSASGWPCNCGRADDPRSYLTFWGNADVPLPNRIVGCCASSYTGAHLSHSWGRLHTIEYLVSP